MERSFKGIWIPKEIWLSKNLTLQEKAFLVEIDSLDNDEGCFASNSYFSDFFGISNSRASQVINGLRDKGYLNVSFEKSGRQITKRILRINRPPYPYLENFTGIQDSKGDIQFPKDGIKYSKEGIKNTNDGHLENCEDNNTLSNNTLNNKSNNKKIKHKYGEYSHVLLTDTDREKLIDQYGERMTEDAITFLDEYIEMKGYKANNHYLAIRKWVVDAVNEQNAKRKKGANHDTAREAEEDKGYIQQFLDAGGRVEFDGF